MRKNIAINFYWRYHPDYTAGCERADFDDSHYKSVDIPHTNIELPINNFDESDYQFVSSYRKNLFVDSEYEGKLILLRFEGVSLFAEVFVNGKKAGEHKGGFTPFEIDITNFVIFGQNNLIAVKVDSTERNDIPPCGYVIDYLTYGGIYREVSLLVRDKTYIKDIFVKAPDIQKSRKITADIEFNNDSFCGKAEYLVSDENGNVFYSGQTEVLNGKGFVEFSAAKLSLWDTYSPNLYNFCFKTDTDTLSVKFGVREAVFKTDGFYLNGKKVKLTGINRHQSYPYVGFAMPSSAQIKDAHIIKKDMGINLVRTSHYPQSRHFIEECDKIGLLVFEEVPGWQHMGDESWGEVLKDNLKEMVLRDRNSPSIILWGVRVNESGDNDSLYKATNKLCKTLDPTRQTGGVRCITNSNLFEDVYTYNDFSYNGENAPLKQKSSVTKENAPYLVTEYAGHMFPTKRFDTESKRLEHALRHSNVLNAMLKDDNVSGAIGWCFCDYNTHKEFGSGDKVCYHGVTDMFRIPKLAYYSYVTKNAEPVLKVSSDFNIGDHSRSVIDRTFVFSNCDKIVLYRNGDKIAEYLPDYKNFSGMENSDHIPPYDVSDLFGTVLIDNENLSVEQSDLVKEISKYIMRGRELPPKLKKESEKIGGEETALNFYNKYIANWGGKRIDYTFEGYRDGKVVIKTSSLVSSPVLKAAADSDTLIVGDTYDVTRVVIELSNTSEILPYAFNNLRLSCEGDIEVIGEKCVSLIGGVRGVWVKTTGNSSGNAKLKIESVGQKDIVLDFKIVKK